MIIPSTRTAARSLGALALVGGALISVPATAATAAATNSAAGVGTKAALNSPLCDAAAGKIKIPSHLPSACTKPFNKGDDNGGATYQGVTKNTIKVVVCVPPIDAQLNPPAGGQPPTNRSTGKVGLIEDAILDAQQALEGSLRALGPEDRVQLRRVFGLPEPGRIAGTREHELLTPGYPPEKHG